MLDLNRKYTEKISHKEIELDGIWRCVQEKENGLTRHSVCTYSDRFQLVFALATGTHLWMEWE